MVCVLQGVFEFLEKQGRSPAPVGLQVMLHGQVPTGMCLLAAIYQCYVHSAVVDHLLLHVCAATCVLSGMSVFVDVLDVALY